MEPTETALPCAGKLVFDTKMAADTAANVAAYQRGLTLRAYRCRYCGLWHLSSQPSED
jgi:hypothetical protein